MSPPSVVSFQINVQEPKYTHVSDLPQILSVHHTLSAHTRFKIILVTGVEEQCYFLLKNKIFPSSIFLQGKQIRNKQATHSYFAYPPLPFAHRYFQSSMNA